VGSSNLFTPMFSRAPFLLLLFLTGACAWNAAGRTGCSPTGPPHALPEGLDESSGVALSRIHPGVFWSHNDGDVSLLYALNAEGQLLSLVPFVAPRVADLEDLATGECPQGSCLYLADTGDNQEVRPRLQLLRVPEPGSLDRPGLLEAEVFPISLPDGPRDIEAIFVLPGEEVFFISKGRRNPVTVYRYPRPLRPEETVTLEAVQNLSEGSMAIPAQITGADASTDGRLVVLRSYEALFFYRLEDGRLHPVEGGRVALGTLREPQGEGVAFGTDSRILLTSEAGIFGDVGGILELECRDVMSR
jgi:hypothetical protein